MNVTNSPTSRRLRAAQATWFILIAMSLTVFVLGIPALHQQLSHPPHAVLVSVRHSGIGLATYVYYLTVVSILFSLPYLALGLLIAYRRFNDSMGLLTSAFLILWAGGSPPSSTPVEDVFPRLAPLAASTLMLMLLGLVVFLFTFPSGNIVPRKATLPLILFVLGTFALFLATGLQPPDRSGIPLIAILGAVFGIGAQIYRYRRISNPVQREQAKWVVYGLAVAIGLSIPFALFTIPTIGVPGTQYDLVSTTVLSIAYVMLPITIAIAILRYKLWDIDVLINRTLVYGSLTLTLAALYAGGVVGLQTLFRAVTGQSSELAVAVVTLLIAALFNPWRHRIQHFIDRRFYRRRYNATHALTALQHRLRDEVDLEQLSADVLAVVQDTLQPSSVALWFAGEGVSEA